MVYKVVEAMVKTLHKLRYPLFLYGCFSRYLEEQHQNEVLYYKKNTAVGSKLEKQFAQATELYRYVNLHPEWRGLDEYKRLSRLLNEQCLETEEGDLIPILATKISANSLQNPTDPDATYRNKGGKGHVGYTVLRVWLATEQSQIAQFGE